MRHEDILSLLNGVLDRLATSDVQLLSLEADGVSLRVEREPSASFDARLAALSVPVQLAPMATPSEFVSGESAPGGGGVQVKAPIVGTFYASPAPDAPPFVTVGSRVSKGDTLCILEAMKMMNEIEAERDGVITNVLLKNGDLAEYGQILFEME